MDLCTMELPEGRIRSGLARCSTMVSSKEEETATAAVTTKKKGGKGRAVREGSTKRTGAVTSSKGEKAATGPPAAAGSVPEGEKRAPDVTPAAAVDADTGGEGGNRTRMCKKYVDYILSWEPTPFQDPEEYYNRMINDPLQLFTQEYIDRSTQSLRNIAEITKRSNERFKKFQDWACAEFEEKGYVEVDDIYIANRVLLGQAVTQEDWDAAMARARNAEALELNGGIGDSVEKQGEGTALESS